MILIKAIRTLLYCTIILYIIILNNKIAFYIIKVKKNLYIYLYMCVNVIFYIYLLVTFATVLYFLYLFILLLNTLFFLPEELLSVFFGKAWLLVTGNLIYLPIWVVFILVLILKGKISGCRVLHLLSSSFLWLICYSSVL